MPTLPAVPTSTITVTGMLGLGAAALLRRIRESRLERSGTMVKLGPMGETAMPRGRVDVRIAGWDPPRPLDRTTAARRAAWAAPATVAGLGLAALGRGEVQWDGEVGGWVARNVRGPSGAMLRIAGMSANTVGQSVLCVTPEPSRPLLDHEQIHVRQFERLGLLMYPLYLWYSARHGYRTNPLEIAARRGAANKSLRRVPRPAGTRTSLPAHQRPTEPQ